MLEHGESFVALADDVIISRLKGSFNEVGCKAYTRKVREIVIELDQAPFAMLIDDLELEGGTPEAYAALDEHNVWINTQHIVAKALLVHSNLQKELTLKHSPALLTQNIEFFMDRQQALDWLKQELAK
ncbi:hypothetical protein [Thalassotalea atypica]|uniref:hypothetical protein n=1 Tax=Thalassotalea atypica TaxID=2054316 RepID=UPI0025728A8B|nr:hypothetical protein [Thalassotalea atypica]